MTRFDRDVIVAGAGAGGAAAALFLKQAGLRVLVVEKEKLPRYKACGGAIPWHTLHGLPTMEEGIVRTSPASVRFDFPGQSPVEVALPDRPMAMVMRSEFDAWLLERSEAEVWDGIAVTDFQEDARGVCVGMGEGSLTARYLVGADGSLSVVARRLGLRRRRRLGGCLEAEVPLARRRDLEAEWGSRALFSLGVVDGGYVWVFPKGDGLSVGIGRFRPGHVDLWKAFRSEMDRLGIPLENSTVVGHPVPCYLAPPWPFWIRQPQEPLSTRRCVLVGDAAGLVDPLIGEGIRHAIASSKMAADAIAQDDLSGYEAKVWQCTGRSLATACLVADQFYRWPGHCYRLGIRNPAAVRHMLDLFTGRTSYVGIDRRLAWATARWLAMGRPDEEPNRARVLGRKT